MTLTDAHTPTCTHQRTHKHTHIHTHTHTHIHTHTHTNTHAHIRIHTHTHTHTHTRARASEGDKLVPSVQKKMNELEVGLLHLQQNIDIPEISLPIHQAIMAVVRKAEEAKRRPSVEDLGASVTDSTFLNALQKDVSRWIREIQKVGLTKNNPCHCIYTALFMYWGGGETSLVNLSLFLPSQLVACTGSSAN